MKSVLSTGLVAALILPSSVMAGSCPKYARGSNRVTCRMFVDQTDVAEKDHGRKMFKHKHKDVEITRTISTYAWSFFWNYIIADECPKTKAHLTTILPPLSHLPHAVKCRVEVRWTPDKHDHDECGSHSHQYYDEYNAAPCNVSWDYAGHGHIDHLSLPAKMEWPLTAGFHRPEQHFKSHELGVKYEPANTGDMYRLDIHSGKGNDFSQSWGQPVSGHYGYEALKDNNGDNNGSNGHKDKEDRSSVKKDHTKFSGYYNTKNLYSCWVFDKFHLVAREVTKKGKHHKRSDDDHEVTSAPAIPHHLPTWSTCEPRIPLPCHEETCEGDSCKQNEACSGDSCHGGHHGSDDDGWASGSDDEGDYHGSHH